MPDDFSFLEAAVAQELVKETMHWEGVVDAVNTLHKKLQKKPRDARKLISVNPGSILNAYREGDVSFKRAVQLLEKWKKTPRFLDHPRGGGEGDPV